MTIRRSVWHHLRSAVSALLLGLLAAHTRAASPADTPLCEGEVQFLESRTAITKDALAANRYLPVSGVEEHPLQLQDAKLAGWRVLAHDGNERPIAARGYLLVLLGDAMLARDVIPMARKLAGQGFDVFSFDYRGFGESSGQASIRQSIGDVRMLVEHLNALRGADGHVLYRQRFVYAMSAGAALGLNAMRAGMEIDGFVAAGLPASFSHDVSYGWWIFRIQVSRLKCPVEIDPLHLLAAPMQLPLILIQGGNDRQLRLTQSELARKHLLVRACRAGANVVLVNSWEHPVLSGADDERTKLLERYLSLGGRLPLGRPGALTIVDRADASAAAEPKDCGAEPRG